VADTKRKERTIVSKRSAVQTEKDKKKNGFPEIPTCASIALDKQSNLNYDSKLFSIRE
jgi:hypothetical protein